MRFALSIAGVVALSSCSPPVNPAGQPLSAPSTREAFGGVQCSSVRPQTEPDLMGWDPGSRANLNRLRRQGVVAVRYQAQGCNVELELLPDCIGPSSKYAFSPYSANERKVAHNESELFAALPIGAARLAGKLKGARALRTDYMLAGQYAVAAGTAFRKEDLHGEQCSRATHVVSAVYVGAFAMGAGESREVDGQATLLGAGAGGKSTAMIEALADEGDAEACRNSQRTAKEDERCAVPLRIALAPLKGLPQASASSLAYTTKRLPNGLHLAVHEDHATPKVAIRITYGRGSYYDPPGRSGMAHLWEHIFFASSKKEYFEEMRKIGAIGINGTTGAHSHDFFAVVPKASLEAALAIEADRMAHAGQRLDASLLAAEKAAVKHEMSTRGMEARSVAGRETLKVVFGASHPYGRGTLGQPDEVDAVSLDEAKAFFEGAFNPAGAIVTLAGDITLPAAEAMTKAFGEIPQRNNNFYPPSNAQARAVSAPTRLTFAANVQRSSLMITWPTPKMGAVGDAELDLVGAILTRRLQQKLVSGSYVAESVQAQQDSMPLASDFSINVDIRNGKTVDDALKAVDVELAQLREGPVEVAELDAARATVLEPLQRSDDLSAKAALIAIYVRRGQNAPTETARYEAVTPAALQEAARGLLGATRVVTIITPDASATTPRLVSRTP